MTLQQFIDKYNGGNSDFDFAYGSHCLDLARFYVQEVWGINSCVAFPQNPSIGGAKHCFTDYPNSLVCSNIDVQRIYNSPTNYPNAGDVIIWNENMGGGFGHIAIVTEANPINFTVLEQNAGNGDGYGKDDATKISKYQDYRNVLGWLHLKNSSSSENPNSSSQVVTNQPNFDTKKISDDILDQIATVDKKANEGWVRARRIEGWLEFGKMLVVDFLTPLQDKVNDLTADLKFANDTLAQKTQELEKVGLDLLTLQQNKMNEITTPNPVVSDSTNTTSQLTPQNPPESPQLAQVENVEFKSKLTITEAYLKNNLSIINSILGIVGYTASPNQITQAISILIAIIGFVYPLYLEIKKSKK
jgi:CHAP domain